MTVDLVRLLTGRIVLGIAAGLGLALTPIAWTIATHAEAHTLHVALVAILLWLLVQWDAHARRDGASGGGRVGRAGAGSTARAPVAPTPGRVDRGDRFLVAAAVVFGLAVGNHSLTLLLADPGRAVRPRRRSRDLAARPPGAGLRRPPCS